jgi:hypothetical protein
VGRAYLHLDEPVDVAINMFDGIDALQTNENFIAHFQAIASNLTPNGLYIFDITHPADCFYGHYGRFQYTGERDGIRVEINWPMNTPVFDFVTGVGQVEIEMRINDHGHEMLIHDSAQERMLSPQEIRLLVELSDALKIIGWYGDFDLNKPFDSSPVSRRMIVVLQKKR